MKNSHRYIINRDCKYFPCHEVGEGADFNCLFCYCPLYALGSDCGGDYNYTDDGLKDCSGCHLPHLPGYYDVIQAKLEGC